jgi:hypothetical protein
LIFIDLCFLERKLSPTSAVEIHGVRCSEYFVGDLVAASAWKGDHHLGRIFDLRGEWRKLHKKYHSLYLGVNISLRVKLVWCLGHAAKREMCVCPP